MPTPTELYQRYVDEYSSQLRYVNAVATISEEDLLGLLGSEFDEIVNDYGSLDEFASADEPQMILDIYSIKEAESVYEHLRMLSE